MKVGVTVRNMGPQSSRSLLLTCAQTAAAAGMESVWITDHIAIPPDDAEGSGGRYLDPLTTLAFLAGAVPGIGLGTGVLILPYRPPLPTAKQIATVQELSDDRLLLGVGIGWMAPEFKALDVPLKERVSRSEAVLDFIDDAFANDEVSLNGQPFLFKPRPAKPPIYIGGAAPHACERALRYGAGWLPMVRNVERCAEQVAEFRRLAEARGKAPGPVTVMGPLPADLSEARDTLARYVEIGIERLVVGTRYDDHGAFAAQVEGIVAAKS